MKNSNRTLLCVAAIAAAILTIACSKDRLDTGTTKIPLPVTAGGLVDLGVVSGDVHHFSLALTGVMIIMPGDGGTSMQTGSNVSMEIFSKTDGVITDGTYSYSDSNDMAAFTFRSALLHISTDNLKSLNPETITGGTVSVSRIGINYTITLEGSVTTGNSFTGHFSGALSYMDTVTQY